MAPVRILPVLPILVLLFVSLGAWHAVADHEGQGTGVRPTGRAVIHLEAMAPGHAVAYRVAIQEELAAHGYDPGSPDGQPGPRTDRAILAYQKDAGLPADGVASKELLDHLKFVLPKVYARYAPLEPQPSVPSVPSVPWSPVPENVPELLPRPGEEGEPGAPTRLWPPAEDERGSLSEPAPGGVVTRVQDALRRRGYYDGPVDGQYGSETGAAVRRFQQDWGLAETGVIDAPLLAVLIPFKTKAYEL